MRQGKTGQDEARQGKTRNGPTRHDMAHKTWQDRTRQDKTRQTYRSSPLHSKMVSKHSADMVWVRVGMRVRLRVKGKG